MKVKELIDKLKEFDPEMEVMVMDSQFDAQAIREVKVNKGVTTSQPEEYVAL